LLLRAAGHYNRPMKVAQLLSVFPQLRWGTAATQEITGLTQDSRQVQKGSVFVAIRGTSSDGHDFLAQAAQQGACALIVEDDSRIPADFTGSVVRVGSSRAALDQLSARYLGNPAEQLFCVGVTGTNGKTTITYMVEKILTHFGWPTGVMGTIDHHLGMHRWPSSLTTPDPLTLHRRLKEFVALGARATAFEVSSHALSQARVSSLPFAVGIFSNFTRDHLDYHQTMDEYFAAKQVLFSELLGQRRASAIAVLNGDDPWIRKVCLREGVTAWWYGMQDADFHFRVLKQDLEGTLFHLTTPRGNCEIHLPCPGLHNVYNAVASAAAGLAAGASLSTVSEALSGFYGAPGRLEKVSNDRGLHIFVDYAHTDDALRSVLSTLRSMGNGGRILTVFGCGGDRDKGKRPLMTAAAAQYSDLLVLTSDNPRSEDPQAILNDMQAGLPQAWRGDVHLEVDRRKAFAIALQKAREGDVILVAGKGHEDYQIVGQERLAFSDTRVLSELLKI
jgi:UDP-N-acetylmuramoyl-L-alanyl-D-glutamate--2,6-diaminopimelate ligase